MRRHGGEADVEAGSRPRGDRLVGAGLDPHGRAATAGRPEILGPQGVLDLQRTAGNAAVGALLEEPSPVHEVLSSGGGNALPTDVRADMEGRFGADFSDVRVHTDDRAHRSAVSVNAQAYTVGSDVVFQRGTFDPASDAGRHVLAHELTHVVQQRSGPVDGSDAGGGVKVSDPGDRFEREAAANADRLMAGSPPSVATAAAPSAVQREEMPEEEEAAQTYVQREEDEAVMEPEAGSP